MTCAVGDKIKMCGERQRYTVQACDDRYIIATKPFNARRTYLYTIIDLERGVRGPCNLIFGPAWDLDTNEGAEEALDDLRNGKVAVSYRRNKPLTDAEIAQLTATHDG